MPAMSLLQKSFCVMIGAISLNALAQDPTISTWNVRDTIKPADVVVQSHRGAGELAPENTTEAFELGWKLGTVPEADVRTTKDGVIVAFHDNNFERVVKNVPPDLAKKGVKDVTWDELSKLDVGSYMDNAFKAHQVCKMDEILALMKSQPQKRLYMDIKQVDFKALADLVIKHGVNKQVILASQHHAQILEWKALVPDSDTLLWVGGKTEAEQQAKFDAAKAKGFECITQCQIHTHIKDSASSITRSSINPFTGSDRFLVESGNELRKHNILFQTLPYGGNSEGVYWKLLDLGLMSFATDHPKVTRAAIEKYYELPDVRKKDKQ